MTGKIAYFHPKKVFLVLLICGLTILFIALTISYIYTRVQNQQPAIPIPWLFYVNTIVILFTGYLFHKAKEHFHFGREHAYKNTLISILVLTLCFLCSQILAWRQLAHSLPSTQNHGSWYLYTVSGLHYLHIVAGLPFFILFLIKSIQHLRKEENLVIHFADPKSECNLQLLSIYWTFLHYLWLYIFLFFLVNSFIG